jgi:hypothetical protein
VSTIEERLSRDIEAVTGGIVVTESDLRDARADVVERIESKRQRDRRRGLVAAAAAAAVVVGVATWQGLSSEDTSPSPAPPVPSPSALTDTEKAFLTGDAVTAGNLPGVWRLDNGSTLFMFTPDGRFSFDDTGQLSTDPLVDGTYAVEGDAISVDIEGGTSGCAGQAITLRAVVSAPGTLHVLPVGREPSGCEAPSSYQWVLEPVLPAGFFSDIKSGPGVNWDPPAGYDSVQATWYDAQGGYLVELRDDGTFTTLTGMGEAADSGTWNVDPSVTRLTLVSGADSSTCREGDRFVLDNLRVRQIGVLNLQGDLGRNDCGVAWKGTGWVRLAP